MGLSFYKAARAKIGVTPTLPARILLPSPPALCAGHPIILLKCAVSFQHKGFAPALPLSEMLFLLQRPLPLRTPSTPLSSEA